VLLLVDSSVQYLLSSRGGLPVGKN